MSEEKDTFAFEKTLGIPMSCKIYHHKESIINAFNALYQCMRDTNKLHGLCNTFFKLEFRNPTYYEECNFPINSYILEMKWGSKKEIQDKKCISKEKEPE
jgi:hypothetical protein